MNLYKFRRFRESVDFERVRRIIVAKELYCCDWRCLNDYLEGTYRLVAGDAGEWCGPLLARIKASKGHWHVCSLSRAFSSSLMWAHYADGFSGVAIEFKAMKPIQVQGLYKVHYDNTPIVVPNNNLDPGLSEELAKTILLRKTKCWKYERESRILARCTTYHLPENLKVNAVYYGPLMSKQCLAALNSIARDAQNVSVISLTKKDSAKYGGYDRT